MSEHGPNVTKLIIKFIAREVIPVGGGIVDGIEFFRNPEHRKLILESAEKRARAAIELIKLSPDNPFGNDEEIAAELLKQIQERNVRRRHAHIPAK